MFHTATLRLTLAYLAVVMTISVLFSLVLYDVSQNEIRAGLRRQLPYLQRVMPVMGYSNSDFQALEDQEEHDSIVRLQLRLVLSNLGILVIAGGVCYWLARRTLHPIEAALEAQGRFTADASHELRTPLTAMKAEIEVSLRDKRLTVEEARELLASNLEEVAKLEALANGLLRLAQHDHSVVPAAEAVSLALIAATAVERKAMAAKEQKITVSNQTEPLLVLGDREHLVELVAILLDNAIKYSPVESTVTITSGRQKGFAWIAVRDEGEGIAAEHLPHLFDRFYRADNARTRNDAGGFGLGLSIARQIAHLYGGSIDVTSRPQKGSVFTVRLPLAP